MPFHRFLEQFQCCFAVPCFGNNAFQHLPLVIDGPPQVVRHPVDLHKHLVEVPAPLFATAHAIHPLAPEFRREHGTKPIPPVAHRFVADLDTPLMQQVFDVAQRQRKPNVEHHRKPDDRWAGFEIAEGGAFGHPAKLAKRHDRLKQSSSDTTALGHPERLPRRPPRLKPVSSDRTHDSLFWLHPKYQKIT